MPNVENVGVEVKPGTTCFLKLTGEPVFVLAIKQADKNQLALIGDTTGLSGKLVVVRRPVLTRIDNFTSVKYAVEEFTVEEILTKEEAIKEESKNAEAEKSVVVRPN